jgi:hypothetical protein
VRSIYACKRVPGLALPSRLVDNLLEHYKHCIVCGGCKHILGQIDVIYLRRALAAVWMYTRGTFNRGNAPGVLSAVPNSFPDLHTAAVLFLHRLLHMITAIPFACSTALVHRSLHIMMTVCDKKLHIKQRVGDCSGWRMGWSGAFWTCGGCY